MTKPEILSSDMEALLSTAIGRLPIHFKEGFLRVEEADPNASAWLGEQLLDLEHQLIKAIQQRVIETVTRSALVDLKIIGQAPQAQEQGQ